MWINHRAAAAFLMSHKFLCPAGHKVPLEKGSPDNNHIADHAPDIRNLSEQQESENRCVDNLGVVKHRDIPRGCMLISCRHRELSPRSGTARQNQEDKLSRTHECEIHQQIGQQYKCRKG